MTDFQYRSAVLWVVGGKESIYDTLETVVFKFPSQRPQIRGLFYLKPFGLSFSANND